jgi:hypothetical protein
MHHTNTLSALPDISVLRLIPLHWTTELKGEKPHVRFVSLHARKRTLALFHPPHKHSLGLSVAERRGEWTLFFSFSSSLLEAK